MPRGWTGDWVSRVVATLATAKGYGVEFDAAWKIAMDKHPPHQWARGPAVPCLEDAGEVPVVEFLRSVCDDAYNDRRPELRELTMAMLLDAEVIGSSGMRRHGHVEVIA